MKLRVAILSLIILGVTSLGYAQINGSHNIISFQKLLTNNTPTAVFQVELPSNSQAGGIILYNIFAGNGTDFQAHAGYVSFTAVNKSGAYTTNIVHLANAAGGESEAASSGSITDTWSITTGASLINIVLNANSSLGVNSTIRFTIFLFNPNRIVLL